MMADGDDRYDLAVPRPSALVESLRSVGYNLPSAIADLVDNSITANSRNVWIHFRWAGGDSSVVILDDGEGMSESRLVEAMRPGTSSPVEVRDPRDLGRFGLGLKTASFSQCRRLEVWTKVRESSVAARCWDLNYLADCKEWRLLRDLPTPDIPEFVSLSRLNSGTLIVWEKVDRFVDRDTDPGDGAAHSRFNDSIKEVKEHLAMVFHRYLAGKVRQPRAALNIFVNGTNTAHAIQPWNPFAGGASARTQEFPVDEILFKGHSVTVKGYVLPHKDRLSEEEYLSAAGPKGWVAQEGFYIYRNDRVLVSGDWLRLGRGRPWQKEEQYRLARLSIDITNAIDLDWAIDVKKSTARPPATLRERITALAERVREDARAVFVHRGIYGNRAGGRAMVIERPWMSGVRGNRTVYKINREHPLVSSALQRLGPFSDDVEQVFRLLEETVPVERIWLDVAESGRDPATPYEGVDEALLRKDARETFRYLMHKLKDREAARIYLLSTPPFDRYSEIVNEIADLES